MKGDNKALKVNKMDECNEDDGHRSLVIRCLIRPNHSKEPTHCKNSPSIVRSYLCGGVRSSSASNS
jgi:hypothetical protein